ncbi:hypothetical protein L2K70_08320 [Nocardioides KLBMP 9356]|uniref:DUF1349 domain-containing protein n=1 Tax=Nocardioides potassii TaxID=2911371 RepID=A0ABS9H8R0_9ACTN|nr:hypothetical protein [Nocardioides potassii]MCF6377606.1 hypothetical protein [Nocardioides potassii]
MELDWAKGNVILADGVEVARAERSWFRERAEVQIGPEAWLYRATSGWTWSSLVAELDGVERLQARRSGFFTNRWAVTGGPEPYEVTNSGFWGTRLAISRRGTQVGEARMSGVFTTRSRIELTEPVTPQVGCFLLWVSHVEFTRRAHSNGAGAS